MEESEDEPEEPKEPEEPAKKVKRRRKSQPKKKKLSVTKEVVKKNARREKRKRVSLKSKLNNLDKILASIDEQCNGSEKPLKNNSDFNVSPKKVKKEAPNPSKSCKGWEVKKINLNSSKTNKGSSKTNESLAKETKPKQKNIEVKANGKTFKDDNLNSSFEQLTDRPQKSKKLKVKSNFSSKKMKTASQNDSTLIKKKIEELGGKITDLKPSKERSKFEKSLHTAQKLKVNRKQLNQAKKSPPQENRINNNSTKGEEIQKVAKIDPWEEELQEGETEVFILNKKFSQKQSKPRDIVIVSS